MRTLLSIALFIAMSALAAEPAATDAGLAAVAELGRVNGTALACGRTEVVNKAKALVLLRAPKTRRYGEAFEDATSAAFRAQATADCPLETILSLQLAGAEMKLEAAFPPGSF
jgi:hypothetical protein